MNICEKCNLPLIGYRPNRKYHDECREIVKKDNELRGAIQKQELKEAMQGKTLTDVLRMERIALSKQVMETKPSVVKKNLDNFLKTRNTDDFRKTQMFARQVLEDWNRYYYEGRIMTNEVKTAMKVLPDDEVQSWLKIKN